MKTHIASRSFVSQKIRASRLLAAMATLALTSSLPVFAVQQTWDGAASGIWDTSALNWGGAAFTSSNDALFTGTPTRNVTTATGLTIGAITLDNTFTGSVALTGNNTMTAATTISGGTLSLSTATGLGTSAVTVNSGGILALNASTAADITYANTVAGAGKVQFLYSATGGHDIYLNNLGSFTGTIQLSLGSGQANTGGKYRQGATMSGTSSLIIDSGTQLYMGTGSNATFANIQVSGTGNTENRGAIRSQSGTLTGAISLLGNTTIGTEGGTIAGSISSGVSGTQTLTLGTSNSTGNLTLNSNITDGSGVIALTKTQAGTTTMSGTSSYSGGTTITAGTLSAGSNTALGTGTVAFNGGTLANSTNVTLANALSTTSATANLTASGGTMVLNGNITGALGVNLTPTNKITLAGTNNFATTSANSFANLSVNAGAGGVDITGSTIVGTGSAANANGYLNVAGTTTLTVQSGGSLTVNGSAGIPGSIVGQNTEGTSTLTVNGGSLTIGGNTGIAFGNNVSTAIGVLTISSGTATINRGSTTAMDQRSFVALGRDTATGTINLNGGTLATDRNFVRDSSGSADVTGAANFNFGGGTLKALANQTDWLNSATINTNQLALSSVTTTSASSTINSNSFTVGINNAITGVGGFHITDSTGTTGVVNFGRASYAYTGATSVDSGTFNTNAASVAFAGNLAVAGGKLTLNGTGAGSVSAAAFSMSSGTWTVSIGDTVSTTGNMSITGGTLDVAAFNGSESSYTASGYSLFTSIGGTGSVSGLSITGYNTVTYTANLSNAGVLTFALASVPEPSTYATIFGALVLGGAALRRRRKA